MENKNSFNTDRLRLQPINENNKNYVFELYERKENIEFLHGINAEADIKLSLECYENYKNIGAYLIFENESDNFIGFGGIQKQEPMFDGSFSMQSHDVEFLIILNNEFKGKGYATEFCDEFFKKLFAAFPTLIVPARVDKNNLSCIKLLKKFGFCEEGEADYHIYGNKFNLLKINFDSWQKMRGL